MLWNKMNGIIRASLATIIPILLPVTTIYQMLQKTILQMATHQRDMRVEMLPK
jgi:hypothetical protein